MHNQMVTLTELWQTDYNYISSKKKKKKSQFWKGYLDYVSKYKQLFCPYNPSPSVQEYTLFFPF